MTKIFYLLGIIIPLFVAGCSKKNATVSTVPATDKIDTSKAMVKYSGSFVSAPGETVSGKALVLLEGTTYTIALQDLNAASGPDLRLYLSKQLQPVNFMDLGKLKSTKGDQVYALTTNPDFKQYKYVLVFCQQFNVLFGSAELK